MEERRDQSPGLCRYSVITVRGTHLSETDASPELVHRTSTAYITRTDLFQNILDLISLDSREEPVVLVLLNPSIVLSPMNHLILLSTLLGSLRRISV